ncbi:nucleoside 2-deoxyribosyltransferase [Aureimonas populi]|uniref:Nucleoside 2-deoxyribosyltransferase n=1 Tax=Aureimonas populi TaxID=1701758 RepID=A0ABW5CRZ9_9HYPH|nr:nucleoside 2-deoxyribosyltransferase [Aureimonas populi]
MRTIYLAGPEVFLPDAQAVMAQKRRRARAHGFEPTGPGSDEAALAAGPATAAMILERNETAMRRAEVCIANVTPFRGISADPGTVYEIGFMIALGRTVHAYTNDPRPYGERVEAEWPGGRVAGPREARPLRGVDGLMIESFGLADNLMIEAGILAHGGRLVRREERPADPARDLSAYLACLRLLRDGGSGRGAL